MSDTGRRMKRERTFAPANAEFLGHSTAEDLLDKFRVSQNFIISAQKYINSECLSQNKNQWVYFIFRD